MPFSALERNEPRRDGETRAARRGARAVRCGLRVGASGRDGRSSELTRLFDAISVRSPRAVADIAARSGLSLDAVRGLLGVLELEGQAAERERGWVRVAG